MDEDGSLTLGLELHSPYSQSECLSLVLCCQEYMSVIRIQILPNKDIDSEKQNESSKTNDDEKHNNNRNKILEALKTENCNHGPWEEKYIVSPRRLDVAQSS